jgi:predicted dehydrogenase
MTLRVGVIGVGYWGPNLVRNLSTSPLTEAAAVADVDPARARSTAAQWGVPVATTDPDEVLTSDGIDAVVITTPARTHAALATRALEAGKHVLVEKPLATSGDDGDRMVRLAAERDLVLMMDHTFCYTSTVRKIAELMHSGDLGKFRYYDSVRVNLGLIQDDIDVFWDLAPHDLSILEYILPETIVPVSVAAIGSDPLGVGHPCLGYLSLTMSDGSLAHVHLNWLSPTKIRTTIIGASKRMLVWDDLNPRQRLSIYDAGVETAPADESSRRSLLVSYRTGDMVAPALQEVEALQRVVTEFAESVAERRRPRTDGRAGLRVLRILEAAQQSIAAGGIPVALDGDAWRGGRE